MTKKITITNRDEAIEEVTALLKEFDIRKANFQQDIYAYVEDGKVDIDTFVNVGGNSWLNDDHITIYSDKPHYESIFDVFEGNLDGYEEICGMSADEIAEIIAKEDDIDASYVDSFDINYYIKNHDELYSKFASWYEEYVEDDFNGYYAETATRIVDEYFEED